MKLLNCLACNDVVALLRQSRKCQCGEASGFYHEDDRTVSFFGPARVLGMRNDEFAKSVLGEHYIWFVIPEPSQWIQHHEAESSESEPLVDDLMAPVDSISWEVCKFCNGQVEESRLPKSLSPGFVWAKCKDCGMQYRACVGCHQEHNQGHCSGCGRMDVFGLCSESDYLTENSARTDSQWTARRKVAELIQMAGRLPQFTGEHHD